MENEKNNLFSNDEEFVSMNEEETESIEENDEDEEEDEENEKGLGGRNMFLFGLLLVVIVSLIALMLLVMHKRDDTDLPEESSGVSSEQEFSDESAPAFSETESNGDIQISWDESSVTSTSEEESTEESDDVSGDVSDVPPEEEPFHGWIINGMGYTYLYYGIGVEQFNYSSKTLNKYTDSLSAIASKLPQGTNVYCMPVPTHIGFLYGHISNEVKNEDNFFNSSQEAFIDEVASRLSGSMNVVDVFQPFSEGYENGSKLYFNTDLNWTSDAAYLAYKEFCAASGNAAITIEAYRKNNLENFLGSFYKATYSEHLEKNADVFSYYQSDDTDACTVTVFRDGSSSKKYNLVNNDLYSTSSAYSIYLGTTAPRFEVKSPCASGKKLLVIGDGSVSAMLPYLVANYSEIQYIDVAQYDEDLSAFLSEHSFNDVLLMTYATNAVKGDYPAHLETIAGVQVNE